MLCMLHGHLYMCLRYAPGWRRVRAHERNTQISNADYYDDDDFGILQGSARLPRFSLESSD